ncbi:MAG: ATP-dependent metallopeptidase FtsH/Yme1/Tma family protein [Deltaproteobacteria bacterium]|nr:MAG: ATP-dependent metallopeptidase FtsH/Yme1/Tma family protein [Deltaproteobacteria bacterium]
MRQSYKTFFLWAVLILLFFSFYSIFSRRGGVEPTEMRASEFYAAVERGDIAEVTVKGNTLQGKLKNRQDFRTVSPLDTQLLDKMRQKGVSLSFEKEDSQSLWAQFLVSWMPLGIICVLFIFLMRQLQAGGGKAMSFGKSKAKLVSENHNKVTFADVAGIDEAKDELEEIIQFLKDPKKFTKLGGRIPKGVLLMGSPGTGKTLLARAIAGEAAVPFFSISGSDFVEMFVGVGASRVRDLFEQGKKHAPCIIFIDEIDAVGRHRGAGLGGGHDEREQTLNQLLVEMDGFESNEGVILIAATNRPDVLDPALLRPGRFDRRIVVPRPDVKGREGILKVHTKKTPLSPEVDLDSIARGTPGFSGADLENLVNEAALLAARKNKERLDNGDFEFAKDKVMMGSERRSMIISEKDKKITAWHEAGHALVARLVPECDPVHKVTIIPRGPALGLTQMLPKEDRLNWNRQAVLDRIAMAMGGRIAEELQFNEITSGAKSDIDHATAFARSMVCEWGMSEKLGPLAFGEDQQEVFLGREFGHRARNFSEKTAIDIDDEVRQIVGTQYRRAKHLLVENKAALDRIAEALLEWETLDGADVETLFAGQPLHKARPAAPARPPDAKRPEVKEKSKILDALGGLTAPVPKVETGKA